MWASAVQAYQPSEPLALRPFANGDLEAVLAIHQHEELRRFVPSAGLETLAAVPDRLDRYRGYDTHPVHGMVAIERVTDGEVVDNRGSQAVCRRLGMADRVATGDSYDRTLRLFAANGL